MCTVTYIPSGDSIYLTSNRDEQHTRGLATPPQREMDLIFPRDPDAGGSWIAMKNNGHAAVLLNGAFSPFAFSGCVSKSRGLLLLEVLRAAQPEQYFIETNMNGVAPFTMVLVLGRRLYEGRWDGIRKYFLRLDASQPRIWSSVTLYNEQMRQHREQWFSAWLQQQQKFTTDNILGFHQLGGEGDPDAHLVMNRENKVFTVSITSIRISAAAGSLTYVDLLRDGQYEEVVMLADEKQLLSQVFPARPLSQAFWGRRFAFAWKQFRIKLFNWEYWPFYAVYGPLYPYWLWLSLKAHSFFFFSAANPWIRNAGFAMERKQKIYDLMPAYCYPKTVFCEAPATGTQVWQTLLRKDFRFPLIAKPDIGQRGLQVKLLPTRADLDKYAAQSKVDFLVQEYVDYTNEAGIFYYRMPGSERGRISGIVGKEFLSVVGNGQATVEALLLKEDRYVLQLPALRKIYGAVLQEVPEAGVYLTLSPYGNHARGARFTDLTKHCTPALEKVIDELCRQLPEFYYGRLDIRYRSWEELCAGTHFSVIELNGAGSEPAHIYDPGHSLWYAWKEIARHWRLLYDISRENATRKGMRLMSTKAGLKMLREQADYLKLIS